jgi:hypothetical protein
MSTMLGGCTILMRIVDHFEQVLCEIYESLAHDIDPRMVVSLSRAFVVLLAAQRPSDSDEPWLSNPACPTSRVQMGAAAHARRVDGARAVLGILFLTPARSALVGPHAKRRPQSLVRPAVRAMGRTALAVTGCTQACGWLNSPASGGRQRE